MSGARVLVDTNVFLAARAPHEPGHAASRRLLDAIDDGNLGALVSVITLAELRAGFTVARRAALWTPFLSHLKSSRSYSIEPVDEEIALAAGELRETTQLRLPDALILATANTRRAEFLATLDLEILRAKWTGVSRRPGDIPLP
ncbi:MAG: PIN domain-containing protein [Thermoplasmata archaeon]|nr:PIN domain-containing protein [Thermoplasmata archaeon]MCI4361597.1 PIN domain-containing protein [Thermoplasmata archaeon]